MVTDLQRHQWTESFAVGRKHLLVIVNLERSSLNVDQVVAEVVKEVLAGLPVGALLADLEQSTALPARTRIESDPAYSSLAARPRHWRPP
jgi:hypothetical protein